MFLIGKCSCQVKDLNPGVDLLMAADWDNLMKTQVRDLPTISSPTDLKPETVTISATNTGPIPGTVVESGVNSFSGWAIGLGTTAAIAGIGGFIWYLNRRN